MIARIISFSRIGSYKNPIWHIGATADFICESSPLLPIDETTLIPFETLTDERLIELSNLDQLSKSRIIIQFHLEQIENLITIQNKKLKAQVWVDRELNQKDLNDLIQYQEFIDLIFVPMGHFDYQKEIESIFKKRNFSCRLLLIPKASIHDPFPTTDNYYYWLQKLSNSNMNIQKLIIKNQLNTSSVDLQNLFLNFNHQNMMNYAKNRGPSQYIVFSIAQMLNIITFNYFSNLLLNIMKPNKPTLLKAIYYDIRQIYLFIKDLFLRNEWRIRSVIWSVITKFYFLVILKAYHFLVLHAFPNIAHKIMFILIVISWPVRKIYWIFKFQIEKRLMGRHKNEV